MAEEQDHPDSIEALAMQCLERLPAEGDSVVAQVCSEHPELVEPVRAVLRQLASLGLTGTIEAPPPDLGEFHLLQKLGQGGMGVVWLAEQRRLHRKVALKLLHPGFQQDARVRERFRREVQALSMLDHPNICTVYEAGEIDHAPYLAMRFVEGNSLAEVLAQRRREQLSTGASRSTPMRPVQDLLQLIEKVARALHAAHEAGVVHRDVKPGNILLDKSGEPVVVDFGLAHADDPAQASLTLTGEPLGTPAYMAPEQIAGKGGIDRRTDVYALGVTLYECVTLHVPFEAQSRDGLYRSILGDPLRDPRTFNRAVGGELRAVLEKALEKAPRRRYATALEFAEELRRLRMHEPTRTRSAGPLLRTLRWCQRNRAATAVLGVVSVALLVVTWLLQRSVAAETGFQALALLRAAERVEPENPELAFKLSREALRLQDDPAAVDPQVVAGVQQSMFQLGNNQVIRKEAGRLEWAGASADGELLVVTGDGAVVTVHRAVDGAPLGELPHRMTMQTPPLAFAPRGGEIAVGDDAGRVHLYDLHRSLRDPFVVLGSDRSRARVHQVAWDRQGTRLVVAHADGTASVWSRTGELVDGLPPQDPAIAEGGEPWLAAAFLPDGRVVAAGAIWSAQLDEPKLLTAADGKVPTAVGVQTGVRRIACSSARLVTYRNERVGARLWDHAGQLLWQSRTTEGTADVMMDVQFDPTEELLAVAYGNGNVDLRAAMDADLRGQLPKQGRGSVVRLAFSADGRRLLLATISCTVEVYEIANQRWRSLTGHLGMVFWAAFLPGGDRLVSASWDGTARIWNLDAPKAGVPQVLGAGVPALARAHAGMVVTTGLGEVLLCDEAANVLRPRGKVGAEWASARVDPSGTKAVIACLDRSLWIWDLARPGDPVRQPIELPGHTFDARFLADGRILLHTLDQSAFVVDQGRLHRVLEPLGEIGPIAVSATGTKVLLGDADGRWHLLRAGNLEHVASGDTGTGQFLCSLAFSPDQQRALVGTYTGHVQLWQLDPPRRLYPPPHLARQTDHQGPVQAVAFAPDGRIVASGSSDGSVRVFDPERRDQALVLSSRDRSSVWSVAFFDAATLVVATTDGAVCWWCLDAAKLRHQVQNVLPKLTEEEGAQYRHLLR